MKKIPSTLSTTWLTKTQKSNKTYFEYNYKELRKIHKKKKLINEKEITK